MRDELAIERYLARYAEQDTTAAPVPVEPWRQVLVLPAYRESAAVLDRLAQLGKSGSCLVILVLNRPEQESDPEANRELRGAVAALPAASANGVAIHRLCAGLDVFPLDLDRRRGALPRAQAVGLARKAGMDTALAWCAAGAIDSQWLCTTDADTTLPADYFDSLQALHGDAPLATFPFRHVPGPDQACNRALGVRLEFMTAGSSPRRSLNRRSSCGVSPISGTSTRAWPPSPSTFSISVM